MLRVSSEMVGVGGAASVVGASTAGTSSLELSAGAAAGAVCPTDKFATASVSALIGSSS